MTNLIPAKDAKFITLDQLTDFEELAERTVDAIIIAANQQVYHESLLGHFQCEVDLTELRNLNNGAGTMAAKKAVTLLSYMLEKADYHHSSFDNYSKTLTIHWD